MPFKEGNQYGKANLGKRKDHAKTLWLLESMSQKGFDFETKLVTLLEKAIKGDRVALEAAHLMVKMLPHVANAPKQDAGTTQIETLVIQRFESSKPVLAQANSLPVDPGESSQVLDTEIVP